MKLSKTNALIIALLLVLAPALANSVTGYVLDEAKAPIANADVELIHDQGTYYFAEDVLPVAKVNSGADGQFTLDVSSTGPMALDVHSPKMRSAFFPLPAQFNPDRPIGIKLSPGASIEGTISGPNGEPVPQAQICRVTLADSSANMTKLRVIPQWLSTNSEGHFIISGLKPDHVYRFLVRSSGLQSADVECTAGISNLKLQLGAGGYTLGAKVSLPGFPESQFADTPVQIVGDRYSEIARAEQNGMAFFWGLPPGAFTVEAMLPPPRFSRSVPVQLPNDAGTTAELRVSNGYTVSGEVRDADVDIPAAGVGLQFGDVITTSDANGRFQSDKLWLVGTQQVQVRRESGFVSADEGTENYTTLPEADGFHDITSVTIRVRVARKLTYTIADLETTTQPVSIHMFASGQRPRDLVVTSGTLDVDVYSAGNYISWATSGELVSELAETPVEFQSEIPVKLNLDPAARLFGNVLHPSVLTTASCALNEVRLFPASVQTSDVLLASMETTGPFIFPRLPLGRYELEAITGARTQRKAVALTAGDNGPIDISFEKGRRFAGIVKTAEGAPVVAATLTCMLLGNSKPVLIETSADGTFDELELPADVIDKIEIAQVGYRPRHLDKIQLPREGYEIILERAAPLSVKVQDSRRSRWRVALMETALASGSDRSAREVALESASVGEAVQLPVPRTARYYVVASEYDTDRVAVSDPIEWNVDKQEPVTVNLRPSATGSLAGSVEGATSGATVTAINTTLPDTARTHFEVKAKGTSFSFDLLPPGDYFVSAIGENIAAEAPRVSVRSGEKSSVILQQAK